MLKSFRQISIIVLFFQIFVVQGQDIKQSLETLSKKYNFKFKELESDTFFTKKYLLEIPQKVDQKNPQSTEFTQRVFLAHIGFDNPVVFITEGYAAGYAGNPRYVNELSTLLNANQICVEHRYFGESVPKPIDWKYLTIKNAAADQHHVHEILKEIYKNKWVSTGISKGGQTTIFYRYFYPDDVDVSVPYVAPINFSIEDKRVYSFLARVGDSVSRKKIYDYQYEMLKNKAIYLPEFQELSIKRHLTYDMGLSKAYELTVLEYSFAFWQWGITPFDSIPIAGTPPDKMVNHLDQVADIEWVSDEGIHRLLPFFYQAMTEIGFYGYDIEPFKEVVDFKINPDFSFTIPKDIAVVYNPEPMQQVDHFIRHKAENILFIYGENDPWSSTAAEITYNTNLLKIVKPGGSHLTRIKNLPDPQKTLAIETLKNWMKD